MVVYIDLVILINFFINIIFIYLIETVFKEKIKIGRLLIGGLVGGLIILAFLADYKIYFFFKIIGGILVSIFGMQKANIKEMIIKISSFYSINFASVGLVASFNILDWYLFIIALGGICIIYFIESNKSISIFTNSLKYNISVTFGTRTERVEGFLDTGNFSSLDDYAIIYLDNSYKSKFKLEKNFYKKMLITTLTGTNYIDSYLPDKFVIEIGKNKLTKKVLIAFSEIKEFPCILNKEIFI